MLIVQIALGIVLAVIILAFLPQILAAGFWLVIAAVAIGIVAGAVSTDMGRVVAGGAIVLVAIGWIVSQLNTGTEKKATAEGEQLSLRLRQDEAARKGEYEGTVVSEQSKDDAAYHKRMRWVSAGIVLGVFVVLPLVVTLIVAVIAR